jgi:class 3 adenylate cyclase
MSATQGRVRYILFTDIGRSSYLWDNFPDQYPSALDKHNQLIEQAVTDHHGEVMKNLGDGYVALFDSPFEAASAAVDLQLQLASGGEGGGPAIPPFPDGTPLEVRAVVHGGQLQQLSAGRGWFGTPLNRVSRISNVCNPGQVLISGSVRVGMDKLPPETHLTDLGMHRLRDLGEPEQIYQLSHKGFARQEYPPLVTLDSRPNNLVIQPNAFIGRDKELVDLRKMMGNDAVRLLTVIAPGGYGKSRIANQLSADMLGKFSNGVFEVRLASVTEHTRLPEAIATATGFQFFGSREPKQQILDYLREKEMLLNFDNFEHLLEGAPFVAEILQYAPKVRVLVTSREPLRLQGEHVYKLDPMPVGPGSDSVQLFVDRASLVKHDFAMTPENSAWVEKIAERLEGVPLALELAAAWADSFTLEEMFGELGSQLELTSRMSDVPERQKSVRASCDWSYRLLGPELRSALRRTSVFRGGFFIDAAEDVLVMKGMKLRKTLADLCDKSWLYTREIKWTIMGETTAQTRYFLRDAAAREYAWEKLEATKFAPGD